MNYKRITQVNTIFLPVCRYGHAVSFSSRIGGPVKKPLIQVDNQSSDGDDESNDHNYAAARVKQSSNKSFRDLLLQPAVKPTYLPTFYAATSVL